MRLPRILTFLSLLKLVYKREVLELRITVETIIPAVCSVPGLCLETTLWYRLMIQEDSGSLHAVSGSRDDCIRTLPTAAPHFLGAERRPDHPTSSPFSFPDLYIMIANPFPIPLRVCISGGTHHPA
jgi:hypothetical protein